MLGLNPAANISVLSTAAQCILGICERRQLLIDVHAAEFCLLLCRWDKKYWATYKVLDILQKVFYRSNPAREAFVEMCESDYVQKMTFDSYLYKVRGSESARQPSPMAQTFRLSTAETREAAQ